MQVATSLHKLNVIFPSSFFHKKKVDEAFKREYSACVETGLYDISFFDYDAWVRSNCLELVCAPQGETKAVYRGWMMKPEQYREFYTALQKQNIYLVTSPASYELMHIFPNVYRCLGSDTASMRIYPAGSELKLDELLGFYPRFMIKDYVKSDKGTVKVRSSRSISMLRTRRASLTSGWRLSTTIEANSLQVAYV